MAEFPPVEEQMAILMRGVEFGDELTRVNMEKELRERVSESREEGRPLRVYCGFDPTSSDLHLGHTVPLRKLRQFQELGHTVIFLIGTFTGTIGDPSDKESARTQQSLEEALEKARGFTQQAQRVLDQEKTIVDYNHRWLGELDFGDVIRLASNFTVQQFLARDNFSKRHTRGEPIWLHEFFYALMQAYDAVAQEADVQVGGQDQLFNILVAGRKLQTGLGQKPQIAIIMGESLPGTDGEIKMSKSLGNHIPLLSEPWDMYGKIMSLPDKVVGIYQRLILGWSLAKAKELESQLSSGALHPNEMKMQLAREIVSIFHSAADADAAQARWNDVFRSGSGVPEDIAEAELDSEEEIRDILVRLKMVGSRGEARRLIQQNGVRLNERKVESLQATITTEMLPAVLQVGKRQFVRLVEANGDGRE
jgi:tyrosyl-tRNA synthetase